MKGKSHTHRPTGAENARNRARAKSVEYGRKILAKLKDESSPPGRASDYLSSLTDHLADRPDMKAIVYGRVSGRTQDRNHNLETHERQTRRILRILGIPIVGSCTEVSCGRILDKRRKGLLKAVRKAKKAPTRVIVSTSADRYLRNMYYTTDEPDLLPTVAEFEKLKALTGGVPLLTLLPPDMSARKVRGIQSRWGQRAKGKKGGRPKAPGYKKRQRQKNLGLVLQLHRQGTNCSGIAYATDTPWSTVKRWVVKYA